MLGLLWSARSADPIAGLALAASPFPSPRAEWDPARWKGSRGLLPRAAVRTIKAAWPVLSLPVQAFGPYPVSVVRDYGRQSIRSRIWTLWSLWGDPSLEAACREAAAALSHAGARVMLAYAADDTSVAPDNADRWQALLAGAERLAVPAGGHQFLIRDRFASIAPWLLGLAVGDHG
ncbi:MAG: hypothetical protein WD096_05835 [Actinomycetota bacterium]